MQLTFREQWTDERLKFDDIGGKFLLDENNKFYVYTLLCKVMESF